MDALPVRTQRLLRLAAADPSGDRLLIWRAADGSTSPTTRRPPPSRPGWSSSAPASGSGIRWPVRPPTGRRRSPRDSSSTRRWRRRPTPAADPDRRAWHRAAPAGGPDEEVAAELEHAAGRAQARGGLAAAAAFLERADAPHGRPSAHAERALAAAHRASLQAGAFDTALELLAIAEAGPLDDVGSARGHAARADRLRLGTGERRTPLLLKAAERLEPLHLDLARETYLSAWVAALFAGRLAGAGDLLEGLPRRPGAPPARGSRGLVDLALDGLALIVTNRPSARGADVRRAATPSWRGSARKRLLGLAGPSGGRALWDDDAWRVMRSRRPARPRGRCADVLPLMLGALLPPPYEQ